MYDVCRKLFALANKIDIGISSVSGCACTVVSEGEIFHLSQKICVVRRNRLNYFNGPEGSRIWLALNVHAPLLIPSVRPCALCEINKGGTQKRTELSLRNTSTNCKVSNCAFKSMKRGVRAVQNGIRSLSFTRDLCNVRQKLFKNSHDILPESDMLKESPGSTISNIV